MNLTDNAKEINTTQRKRHRLLLTVMLVILFIIIILSFGVVRFYRCRFSKDTQGIGLGLPLAKAVIEAHGGAIEVDSELGRGTSFTINFLIPTKL